MASLTRVIFRALLPLLLSMHSKDVVVTATDNSFQHGWGSSSEMTFADFNSPTVLTDAQTTFAASKYRILSLEKCTGVSDNIPTEEAIYTIAGNIKKKDPTIKVLFYWATDQQGIKCYAANGAFQANPSWWLKADNGSVLMPPKIDTTNPDARAWWVSIPFGGINGTGMFRGVPVSKLIDGVLADGAGYGHYPGIADGRLEKLADAKLEMIQTLQTKATQLNGGIIMSNGLSMYGPPNADPRYPDNHNLRTLDYSNAVMNEHTAVFESVNIQNASFNLDTVSKNLDVIVTASKLANGSKTVFLQTWPGMYSRTNFYPRGNTPASVYPPVANGGEPTPQNNDEWRAELRKHFAFAHALFLSVAEPNVYWMYAGVWYPSNTGYLACPEDLTSCPAPPEWYPDLDKPLGPPKGPRQQISPYVWTREFEHATVHLDLIKPDQSGVTFF